MVAKFRRLPGSRRPSRQRRSVAQERYSLVLWITAACGTMMVAANATYSLGLILKASKSSNQGFSSAGPFSQILLLQDLFSADRQTASQENHSTSSARKTARIYAKPDSSVVASISNNERTAASFAIHPPLLQPDTVLAEYKEQHSFSVWMDDKDDDLLRERKFALIDVDCSIGAASIWGHAAMNSLLFSIATNRTLLYRYVGDDVRCRQVVQPNHWIGSYNEVEDRLDEEPVQLYFNYGRHDDEAPAADYARHFDDHFDIVPWYKHDKEENEPLEDTVVVFPILTRNLELNLPEFALFTGINTYAVHRIFSMGQDYMYGMLWEAFFQFGHAASHNLPASVQTARRRHQSHVIALHIDEDEDLVESFQPCLSQMLTGEKSGCAVVPVTNNRAILPELHAWMLRYYPQCQLMVADEPMMQFSNDDDDSSLFWLRQVELARRLGATKLSIGPRNGLEGILLGEILEYRRVQLIRASKEEAAVSSRSSDNSDHRYHHDASPMVHCQRVRATVASR